MDTDLSGDAVAWPWSALGIAPTADKAAIHAAHDARRAEMDAASARISDFADLTAARGKALFLAAEMQRQSEREGTVQEAGRERDEPEVAEQAPPPPPPAPEAEECEQGGTFSSTTDSPYELPDGNEDGGFEKADDDDPAEWEHGGDYRPEFPAEPDTMMEDLVKFAGLEDSQRSDADGSWSGPGPTPFLERYSLDRYGFFILLGLFLLLALYSGR
ncbi:MAG: hypothetical protein ACX930_12420 [Erythrobacter sp.]